MSRSDGTLRVANGRGGLGFVSGTFCIRVTMDPYTGVVLGLVVIHVTLNAFFGTAALYYASASNPNRYIPVQARAATNVALLCLSSSIWAVASIVAPGYVLGEDTDTVNGPSCAVWNYLLQWVLGGVLWANLFQFRIMTFYQVLVMHRATRAFGYGVFAVLSACSVIYYLSAEIDNKAHPEQMCAPRTWKNIFLFSFIWMPLFVFLYCGWRLRKAPTSFPEFRVMWRTGLIFVIFIAFTGIMIVQGLWENKVFVLTYIILQMFMTDTILLMIIYHPVLRAIRNDKGYQSRFVSTIAPFLGDIISYAAVMGHDVSRERFLSFVEEQPPKAVSEIKIPDDEIGHRFKELINVDAKNKLPGSIFPDIFGWFDGKNLVTLLRALYRFPTLKEGMKDEIDRIWATYIVEASSDRIFVPVNILNAMASERDSVAPNYFDVLRNWVMVLLGVVYFESFRDPTMRGSRDAMDREMQRAMIGFGLLSSAPETPFTIGDEEDDRKGLITDSLQADPEQHAAPEDA